MPHQYIRPLSIIILPSHVNTSKIASFHSEWYHDIPIDLVPFHNESILSQVDMGEQCLIESYSEEGGNSPAVTKKLRLDKKAEKKKYSTITPYTQSIHHWIALFKDILDKNYTNLLSRENTRIQYISILFHLFSKRKPETETISIVKTETISIRELEDISLAYFEENVRYNITAK